MTNVCSICNHIRKLEIDREIVKGRSFESISRQFGVSSPAIRHHSREHLSRQLVQAYEKKELDESMNLLGRIDKILFHAEQIFERNYAAKHDVTALKALDSQRQTIDLLARISMFLHQARAEELQAAQRDQDSQRKAELDEFVQQICDRLNPAELDLWEKLASKIRGDHDDEIIPYQDPFPAPPSRRTKPPVKPEQICPM